MQILLDYGKNKLPINLEGADIINVPSVDSLCNPSEVIYNKLDFPDFGLCLKEKIKNKTTVAIAHTDITRATPNNIIIPVIINRLLELGIRKENITLINMTGSHRPQTNIELIAMLGENIVNNFRCVQHNSFDIDSLSLAGIMDGIYPLYINREFYEADFKIITGFIEPHFFAGFSGGPKAILPGISDINSIMRNHNAIRISDERATWGILHNNPVWENIREGARIVNPDFLINVALNTEGKISGVFSGDWEAAHLLGCEFVKSHSMIKVNKLYDTVITTNSGYPLDMNLYQCVKGMSVAAQIVKPGGNIIMVGECSDGIPDNSHYHNLLKMESSPEKLFDHILNSNKVIPEQWQVQIQTRIQKKAKIYLYSDFLSDEKIIESMLIPCRDIEKLVNHLGGEVAVIPHGPQTIPFYS